MAIARWVGVLFFLCVQVSVAEGVSDVEGQPGAVEQVIVQEVDERGQVHNEWVINIALYAWFQDVEAINDDGTFRVPVNLSQREFMERLRGGYNLVFEVEKNNWILHIGPSKMQLEGIQTYAESSFGNIPIEVNSSQTAVEVLAGHRFTFKKHALEVYGGIRSVELESSAQTPFGQVDSGTDFTDSLFVGRYTFNPTRKLQVFARIGVSDMFNSDERAPDYQVGVRHQTFKRVGFECGYKESEIKYNRQGVYISNVYSGGYCAIRGKIK